MLGRKREFDERSKRFGIRELLPDEPLKGRSWYCSARLDQGETPMCVGFGWSHELNAYPIRVTVSDDSAKTLYGLAQKYDGFPDDEPGSSVLGGAKAVQSQGHMPEYRWAFGIDDVMQTLAHFGPVVLGTDWHNAMFYPGASALLEITGTIEGGHCYLARGLLMRPSFAKEPVIRCRNSWGANWGHNADFFLRASDLESLLKDGGEACVPVIRK